MREDRKRRRRTFKFTGKKKSKKGMLAIILALCGLVGMGVVIEMSFQARGQGTVYLGSVGLLSMGAGIAAFLMGLKGLREEDTYKLMPAVGFGAGIVTTAGWLAIYVGGFIG